MNIQELESFFGGNTVGKHYRRGIQSRYLAARAEKSGQKMDAELGVILLEGKNNGVFPTKYGKLVADRSKEI